MLLLQKLQLVGKMEFVFLLTFNIVVWIFDCCVLLVIESSHGFSFLFFTLLTVLLRSMFRNGRRSLLRGGGGAFLADSVVVVYTLSISPMVRLEFSALSAMSSGAP